MCLVILMSRPPPAIIANEVLDVLNPYGDVVWKGNCAGGKNRRHAVDIGDIEAHRTTGAEWPEP
jgi:hypothetical protein